MALKQAFNYDVIPRNFKPFFFMPDQQDIHRCLDILQKKFKDIKNLFIYLSTSRGAEHSKIEYLAYPFVSQDRMKDFLEEIGLVDHNDHEKVAEDNKYVKSLKIDKQS